MSLLLFLIFFALFISALFRGHFTYSNVEYSFREHPVQFVIVLIFILGVSLLCLYRFLVEMKVL